MCQALCRQTWLLVAHGVEDDCPGIRRVLITQRSFICILCSYMTLALLGEIYRSSQGSRWFIPRVSHGFFPHKSRLAAQG